MISYTSILQKCFLSIPQFFGSYFSIDQHRLGHLPFGNLLQQREELRGWNKITINFSALLCIVPRPLVLVFFLFKNRLVNIQIYKIYISVKMLNHVYWCCIQYLPCIVFSGNFCYSSYSSSSGLLQIIYHVNSNKRLKLLVLL